MGPWGGHMSPTKTMGLTVARDYDKGETKSMSKGVLRTLSAFRVEEAGVGSSFARRGDFWASDRVKKESYVGHPAIQWASVERPRCAVEDIASAVSSSAPWLLCLVT